MDQCSFLAQHPTSHLAPRTGTEAPSPSTAHRPATGQCSSTPSLGLSLPTQRAAVTYPLAPGLPNYGKKGRPIPLWSAKAAFSASVPPGDECDDLGICAWAKTAQCIPLPATERPAYPIQRE